MEGDCTNVRGGFEANGVLLIWGHWRRFVKVEAGQGASVLGEVLQASMHSQKIGAALRHIDIWHGSETHRGAIAVNPYGGVQETSEVLRAPATKKSFYDIRAKATDVLVDIENAKNAADISPNAHFLMANLVRGGVFGSSSKKAEANG